MATKVSIRGFSKLSSSIKENLRKVLKDTRMIKELTEASQRDNKADVSLGKDPVTGKKFQALSAKTIAQRKALAKYNSTSNQFKASKSNLTFTGQLVKAIRSRAVLKGDTLNIFNYLLKARKGYKNQVGGTSKTPNNIKIAGYLKDMGRNTLGYFIDTKRRKKITNIIRAALRRRLR